MITLVVAPEHLTAAEFEVEGAAYRHLFRSRRAVLGDRVRLVDGAGRACWSTVAEITRACARLVPGPPAPANEPARPVVVLVPSPKPQRLAWMVEKLTELGVDGIRLIRTERAPRRPGRGTLERLRRVAVAAVEQCHRARVPRISGPHEWEELSELLRESGDLRWVLDREGLPPRALAPGQRGSAEDAKAAAGGFGSVAVLVGPEGGWTADELVRLDELSCRRLSLGSRTLRLETAAVVAAGLLLLE